MQPREDSKHAARIKRVGPHADQMCSLSVLKVNYYQLHVTNRAFIKKKVASKAGQSIVRFHGRGVEQPGSSSGS